MNLPCLCDTVARAFRVPHSAPMSYLLYVREQAWRHARDLSEDELRSLTDAAASLVDLSSSICPPQVDSVASQVLPTTSLSLSGMNEDAGASVQRAFTGRKRSATMPADPARRREGASVRPVGRVRAQDSKLFIRTADTSRARAVTQSSPVDMQVDEAKASAPSLQPDASNASRHTRRSATGDLLEAPSQVEVSPATVSERARTAISDSVDDFAKAEATDSLAGAKRRRSSSTARKSAKKVKRKKARSSPLSARKNAHTNPNTLVAQAQREQANCESAIECGVVNDKGTARPSAPMCVHEVTVDVCRGSAV